MGESEASIRGRVMRDLISHVTNDLLIGRKIKSGELRKRLVEPNWIVPGCILYLYLSYLYSYTFFSG